ncbi:MAG: hypothetical protein AB7S26_09640 [Sandaracinaceae bacterium]
MRMSIVLLSGLAALAGCDGGGAPDAGHDAGMAGPDAGAVNCDLPDDVDLTCPGAPGCDGSGDGMLYAGAAAVEFTPDPAEAEPLTVDVDGDGELDSADGDQFTDTNGNGMYDAVWIAGFGNGRAARSVDNPQWARAIALRENDVTIVFVSLDAVGWFFGDSDPIREMTADLEIDHLSISATHTHEARDTIGIWGRTLDESGRSPAFMAHVQERAAQAVRDAVGALRPANIQYASLRLRDQPGGLLRYVGDSRDPQVIDDEVRILRLMEAGDGPTIATLVNLASHPEYAGSRNTALSSDYPNWLRLGIENGVEGPDGPLAGVGGIAVFINGALGAQIGPGRVQPQTWDGTDVPRGTIEASQTVGEEMAAFVLTALGPTGGSTTQMTASLGFRRHRFFAPIENRRYHIAFLQELFVRDVYCYNPDYAIRPTQNIPFALTEVAVIDVGDATMITIPGELDPALFVGGYDGSYAPDGVPVVDTTQENPPDLTMAPSGPYLRDLARSDAQQVWLLGLTNDFLGYLLPEFDYELDQFLPYIGEAPGDHYEETNSIGPMGWPTIHEALMEVLGAR